MSSQNLSNKFTIQLTDEQTAAIDRIAEKNRTTRAAEIRTAIERHGSISPERFNDVTHAIHKAFSGYLTQHQAQHIAAIAVTCIYS
jgi:predicted transcriptional regulator